MGSLRGRHVERRIEAAAWSAAGAKARAILRTFCERLWPQAKALAHRVAGEQAREHADLGRANSLPEGVLRVACVRKGV